jgi:hypothetical protein
MPRWANRGSHLTPDFLGVGEGNICAPSPLIPDLSGEGTALPIYLIFIGKAEGS